LTEVLAERRLHSKAIDATTSVVQWRRSSGFARGTTGFVLGAFVGALRAITVGGSTPGGVQDGACTDAPLFL